VFLVLRSLRHSRTANFIGAWQEIANRLQSPEVVGGRVLLRALGSGEGGAGKGLLVDDPSSEEVLKAFGGTAVKYVKSPWHSNLTEKVASLSVEDKAQELRQAMVEAVGTFDIVAILAIQSGISGLLDVVVVEWLDNIIACFENGAWVVRRRVECGRLEQFQCFSVLYVRALRRRKMLEEMIESGDKALVGDRYPYLGWRGQLDKRSLRRDAKEAARIRASLLPRKEAEGKGQ